LLSHPLRPKENFILVCEGPSDLQFLQGIWNNFAPEISVYHAGGHRNVRLLADVLTPSVYILDRDFSKTLSEAHTTLEPGNRFTLWPRQNIECYLLYPDWLQATVEEIQRFRSRQPFGSPPSTQEQIEQSIIELAVSFIPDHAGRRTLNELTSIIGPQNLFSAKADRNVLSDGANANDQQMWESYLVQETHRLREQGKNLTGEDKLEDAAVIARYHNHIEQYRTWTNNLDLIRNEFSGKRFFQALALKWGLRGTKTGKKPWEVLRDVTIEQAVEYCEHISSQLTNDPRLGDFGQLAKKVTNREI
jgi:hypothetical protein